MASMSLCFTPQASARPGSRNPRKPVMKKTVRKPKASPNWKQSATYKSPPDPIFLSGGDATTYTRLPPKDELVPSFTPPCEVKLSDSRPPPVMEDEVDEKILVEGEEEEERAAGVFGERGDGKYKVLEVFEGNSDFEYDDENWDEYDDLGFTDGKGVNLHGNENGEEFSEVENVRFYAEKGDPAEADVKDKGLPAVMRCFDRARIYVKAGDGGNGVVAFRREKYVPMGGPSGGDGGRGGNVYIEVDRAMNSLLPFRNSVHFRAGRGSHGQGRMQIGAKGEDVVVKVAPGTVIREAGKEEVLLELLYPGQKALLLPGGKGGRGNASFKSGNNKVPRIAENGEEGHEMYVDFCFILRKFSSSIIKHLWIINSKFINRRRFIRTLLSCNF